MTRPAGRSLWSLWLRSHAWLGLGLGVVFALFGLTGSLLVFTNELDAALNPALLVTTAAGERIGADDALSAVDAGTGDDFRVAWLSAPRMANGAWQAFGGPADDPFGWMTAVDPITGEVLGQRRLGTGPIALVHDLHTSLRLGASGRDLAGVIGMLMALSLVTGLVAWASTRTPAAARAPRAGGVRSLHRTLGIWVLPPLLVIVVTGIFMRLPAVTNPVIEWFSPLTDPGATVGAEATAHADNRLPLAAALARARTLFPDAPLTGVGLPRPGAPAYQFAFREAEHPRAHVGRSYVWVAPDTGRILASRRWAELTGADRFRDWLYPLHSGSAFGTAGKWIVLMLGLAPSLLLATGAGVWWSRRRRARTP